MVDRGYLLGGCGFIRVICGWQNWWANPPLQNLDFYFSQFWPL